MKKILKVKSSTDYNLTDIVVLTTLFSYLDNEVYFVKSSDRVNAKSVLGIQSLEILIGEEFEVELIGSKRAIDFSVETFGSLSDYFVVEG